MTHTLVSDTLPLGDFVAETRRIIEPPRVSRYGRLPISRINDPAGIA